MQKEKWQRNAFIYKISNNFEQIHLKGKWKSGLKE